MTPKQLALLTQINNGKAVGWARLTVRRAEITLAEMIEMAQEHFANPLVRNPEWTHLKAEMGPQTRTVAKR